VLLTRAPLSSIPKDAFSFDLHVLGTPPAFILSQDQTLRQVINECFILHCSAVKVLAVESNNTNPALTCQPLPTNSFGIFGLSGQAGCSLASMRDENNAIVGHDQQSPPVPAAERARNFYSACPT
jgi:hypothetical protein